MIRRHTAAPSWSCSAKSSSASAALSLERFLAVALEHQAGCAPDVDLRNHGKS